jgi:hypothetical protein
MQTKTLAELFTIEDGDWSQPIRTIVPQFPFPVNKDVVIGHDGFQTCIAYKGQNCPFSFTNGPWELALHRFLLGTRSKTVTLKDVTVTINPEGEIYPSSILALEKRIRQGM